jgi:hypothetical protein
VKHHPVVSDLFSDDEQLLGMAHNKPVLCMTSTFFFFFICKEQKFPPTEKHMPYICRSHSQVSDARNTHSTLDIVLSPIAGGGWKTDRSRFIWMLAPNSEYPFCYQLSVAEKDEIERFLSVSES